MTGSQPKPGHILEQLLESQPPLVTLLNSAPVPGTQAPDWEQVIPPSWRLYPGKPQPCRFEEEGAQALLQFLTNRLP